MVHFEPQSSKMDHSARWDQKPCFQKNILPETNFCVVFVFFFKSYLHTVEEIITTVVFLKKP